MKSYNPFKMWGSYLIPILAILDYFSQAFVQGVFCPKLDQVISAEGVLYCSGELTMRMGLFGFMLNPLVWYLIVIFGGFILGWGIHSLMGYLRK